MGLGIYLTTIKSEKKIVDLPFYQTVGGIAIIVNFVLLIKWIIIYRNESKL